MISPEEASNLRKQHAATLEADLDKIDEYKPNSDMLQGKWAGMVWPNTPEAKHEPRTGLPADQLKEVAKASVTLPEDFASHRVSWQPHALLTTYRTSTAGSRGTYRADSRALTQKSILRLPRPWLSGR